jgi:Zn-dependent metalloprotease
MMRFLRYQTCVLSGVALLSLAANPAAVQAAESQAVQRFLSELGGAAEVKVNPATGVARFVRLAPGGQAFAARTARAARPVDAQAVSDDFLGRHGAIFGLRDGRAELVLVGRTRDAQGGVHFSYAQHRHGVPVFGAFLKTHLDAAGELRVVNGITVPDLDLDVVPARTAAEAEGVALVLVGGQASGEGLVARDSRLLVYRAGLLKGVAGPDHLAWQVEVGNGRDVREFVYVDARTGKVVDQITGVHDAMFRRAYDGAFLPNVPPSYPASPFWVEGDTPFPTGVAEADNMLVASQETYDLYFKAFGRDSWDGVGGMMDSIFNRGYSCPNASWNGTFISFCAGFTTDDVTAHEWGHAYTERTHGLVYAWQSGALNEAYSDIWGETLDRINGRGANDPGGPRSAAGEQCSAFQIFAPETRVNSPASIAADYASGTSAFSPIITAANAVTADVVRPNDGSGNATDGCCGAGPDFTCAAGSWVNAADIAGRIVLVDRGTCGFSFKARNAELHGAAGVIIANVATSGSPTVPPNMAGTAGVPPVAIPVTSMNVADGDLLRGALATGPVNASLQPNAPATTDNSNRWLIGEDINAVGLVGALRDMWNPNCFGDPGRVTDTQYFCGTGDNGGVHFNSGVPNHAYALLVDGGSYNGQTIAGIGLTKAAHIYYRAQSTYQGPASNFADHADAIEQSCLDLVGDDLEDLLTGAPSGQIISAADCVQVANAMLAVEMRTPPDQCGFLPILAKNPPDRCEAGTAQANVFFDNFETNPLGPWTVSHTAVVPDDFTPRDWVWANDLPSREGSALFAVNFPGGTCAPGGDESGAIHAFSPVITLPPGAANPRLTFDHWIATEGGWDGGNLKISVNGGPAQLVAAADFTYNPYNATLQPAPGNTNPMAGQPAFTGTDGGAVDGSWGRSHVNLAPYAGPGSTVQLQFDLGNDGCTGFFGWYVDDPTVYSCVPADPPLISIGDASVAEGNTGFTTMEFKVTLSQASAKPVEVWYITLPGSAWPLIDFVPDLGKVTIAPLQLEGRIRVKVVGDRFRERDETMIVTLLAPSGGAILDGVGVGRIVNDDGGGH